MQPCPSITPVGGRAGRPHAPHTWRFLATDGVSLLAYRWRHRPPVAEALGASASDTPRACGTAEDKGHQV